MEKIARNQYKCKKGESVTLTFDPHGSTVPLETRAYLAPPSMKPDKGPDIDTSKDPHTLTFTVNEDTAVRIHYSFTNPGSSYEVTAAGSGGGSFTNRVNQSASVNPVGVTYTFAV